MIEDLSWTWTVHGESLELPQSQPERSGLSVLFARCGEPKRGGQGVLDFDQATVRGASLVDVLDLAREIVSASSGMEQASQFLLLTLPYSGQCNIDLPATELGMAAELGCGLGITCYEISPETQ